MENYKKQLKVLLLNWKIILNCLYLKMSLYEKKEKKKKCKTK